MKLIIQYQNYFPTFIIENNPQCQELGGPEGGGIMFYILSLLIKSQAPPICASQVKTMYSSDIIE